MYAPHQERWPARGAGWRKAIAVTGAVAIFGGVLLLSRTPLPSAPMARANAQDKAGPSAVTTSAVEAANAFLVALEPGQREKALYEYGSNKKPNWSNLPVTMVQRNGLRLGDLTPEQREKAMAVLAAVLSKEGYQKVVDIMDSDQVLVDAPRKGGKGKAPAKKSMFGKDQYYLAIFGRPSPTNPCMVQFGGHHLGVNITVVGKHFVLTPSHTGTQPAVFQRDGKTVRPLGREIDAAFKLMGALDAGQRSQAIIAERAQSELLVGPGRDGRTIEPQGIKASNLNKDQQALLVDVIAAWVNMVEPDTASARMAEIRQQIGETYFAWSGSTEPGQPVYFRVQGPTIIIEYAPQGGTDHIHTIIRNPRNEYGAGITKP